MRLPSLIGRKVCPVRYRPAGYYRPQPEGISETARRAILDYSHLVCQGKFLWFGNGPVYLGMPPRWQVDFVSGKDWPLHPSDSLILVRHDGSDVRTVWELSRLQFLPVLGKAWRLCGEDHLRNCAKDLLSSWIEQNPVGLGVNWTVAMEAALRATSICLFLELLSPFSSAEQTWLELVTRSLWEHLLFIEAHNEFSHFARSNHYLSNIAGLFCLSVYLDGPEMDARSTRYGQLVQREIAHQVNEDGGDYEASVGYHTLVAQIFTVSLLLMNAIGIGPAENFLRRLRGMYQLMAALADNRGRLPQVGDCDDGRAEILVDDVEQMVASDPEKRDSLNVSGLLGIGGFLLGEDFGGRSDDACWYGAQSGRQSLFRPDEFRGPRVFPCTGVATVRRANSHLLFFAMRNGIHGRGSHTHNDKLSTILRIDGNELLTDRGTFCYSLDGARRNLFRSTLSHNTVRVDQQEQNRFSERLGDLFRMQDDAGVSVIQVADNKTSTRFSAEHNGYKRLGVIHRRAVLLDDKQELIVEDEFWGNGRHSIEAAWQLPRLWQVAINSDRGCEIVCMVSGPLAVEMRFSSSIDLSVQSTPAEISTTYGCASLGATIIVSGSAPLPLKLRAHVSWTQA